MQHLSYNTMASQVRGFSEMVARLNSYSANVQQEVKEVVELTLGDIETEAIANAPGPGEMIATEGGPISQEFIADKRRGSFTPISQAIGYEVDRSGYKGSVYVEKSAGDIAVYVEMGTGQSAASYLATVPTYWRAIAAKYVVNRQGTILNAPYLLPAFLKHSIEFKKELKEVFKATRL